MRFPLLSVLSVSLLQAVLALPLDISSGGTTSITSRSLLTVEMKCIDVEAEEVTSVQQFSALLKAERVVGAARAEDVLQSEEVAEGHLGQDQHGGGQPGGAGEVGEERPEEGTEEDQEVPGEGDCLVISATDQHLAPTGGHQLEGGLENQDMQVVSIAGSTGSTGGHRTGGSDLGQLKDNGRNKT